MAKNNSKVVSGGTIERRHVSLLILCVYTAVAVMAAVLVLQVLGLFTPPMPLEDTLFGTSRPTFTWSPITLSVFLLLPSILLTLGWIYLRQYFKRNAHGTHIIIPYFEKHPRKKSAKYLYYGIAVAASVACVILALISFIQLGKSASATLMTRLVAFIPCLSMGFAVVAFLLLTCLLRHRKRTYAHHRRVQEEARM
ncbi:MAG: hypothetical protein J5843_01405, partial [Clostridia bacterium]|nr:hypothetical protein [Clostridia bacterium]